MTQEVSTGDIDLATDEILGALDFNQEPTPEPTPDPVPEPDPEPTPGPEPSQGPEENPSIENFTPQTFEDFQKELEEEDSDPDPASDPEPEPTPEPGEERHAEALKSIRGELEKKNAELEEARREIAELRDGGAKNQGEFERLQAENKTLLAKLSVQNPEEHPEIVALRSSMDGEITSVATAVRFDKGAQAASSLTQNINRLCQIRDQVGEPGSQGYDDRWQQYKDLLSEQYGDSNAKQVAALVEKCSGVLKDIEKKQQQLANAGADLSLETATKAHRELVTAYEKEVEPFISPTAELKESDPAHPLVVLDKLMSGNQQLSDQYERIKKMTRFAALPLPPIQPQEIDGKSEEQIQQILTAREEKRAKAVTEIQRMTPPAIAFYMTAPKILREMAKMSQRLKELQGVTPPAPTEDPKVGPEPPDDGSPKDPKQFEIQKPPPLQ